MATTETFSILLPKAINLGNSQVSTREFPVTCYVNRTAYYVAARMEKIQVNPAWAKVRMDVFKAGFRTATYASKDGIIEPDFQFNHSEESFFSLYNDSIDTEALIAIEFRAWQYGEA